LRLFEIAAADGVDLCRTTNIAETLNFAGLERSCDSARGAEMTMRGAIKGIESRRAGFSNRCATINTGACEQ